MAVTCALSLTAAHGWCYALIMFKNDYNLNLTVLPPTSKPRLSLCQSASLSVNLFMEWNSKLTKFQMAMGKASEQCNKLGNKTHQCLHLHFHLIFLWPVALCTESIFLTPFPIYYWETAGRKGKYWLECSLCLLTDCTLHKNSDEIAVCFLFLCLYFIWESNDGCLMWLRCDSQYTFISPSARHVLSCFVLTR